MKKMFKIKNILSLILVFAMVIGFMPAFSMAFAVQEPQPGEEYDESVEAIDNVSSKEDNEISDVVEHEAPQEEAAEEHGEDIDETISEEPDGDKTEKETRSLEQALRECLAEVIAGSGVEVKASSVKELNDFAGNKYYLVEFKDGGYMICHGATGELMEYATEGKSPYYGYSDGLIYLAATHYYHLDNGYYVDNLENTQKITASRENLAVLAEKSNEIQQTILESTDKRVESTAASEIDIPEVDTGGSSNPTRMTAYNVPDHTIITNKTSEEAMGYEANHCGFIAAGLVLAWIDKKIDTRFFINDMLYYDLAGDHFKGNDFTLLLKEKYTLTGNVNGANATLLEGMLKTNSSPTPNYFGDHKLSGTVTPLTSSSQCTISSIRGILSGSNVPVIIIDNFSYLNISGVANHAAVAYGYDTNGYIKIHTGVPGNVLKTLSQSGLTAFDEALYITNPGFSFAFSDDPSTSAPWKERAARFVLSQNYMSVVSTGYFRYNYPASRGVFVNAIYEMAGHPTVTQAQKNALLNAFSDINSSSIYLDAAAWAYAKGILTGILGPDGVVYLGLGETLTREQAVTFFYRLYTCNGLTFVTRWSGGPAYTTFTDYTSVHTYARTAMNWATTHYIIEGSGNYLYPQDNLTRAELAKMISNFCDGVKKD